MMVSPNNNDVDVRQSQGQQQQQQQQQQQESTSSSTTIVRGPRTVSSLSSLETTGYEDLNDIGQGLDFNFPNTHAYTNINNQQSIVPSPLLPSLMESRTSSNTLVTTSTTAASAGGDIMEQQQQQQQQQHQQHHSQELQQHPLAVTSSIASLAVIPVQSSGIIATGSMQIIPPSTGGVVMASAVTNSNTANANTVPEFLYQLTKMLTDNNRDIIEWSNCKCEK
jgi:transcription initiation factor TFIID subunit TAF12